MSCVYKKDGKYLRYSEHTNHTGTHRASSWVDDLQLATVFYAGPPLRLRQDQQLSEAERIEATETRRATLVSDMTPPLLSNDVLSHKDALLLATECREGELVGKPTPSICVERLCCYIIKLNEGITN